jgi:hypothetical protein
LQEAKTKSTREWSALQQRLNTALSISDVSSTSLQEAKQYEQQLTGDLARMAEQRERRAPDASEIFEKLESVYTEGEDDEEVGEWEQEDEEEVVLLSDSEDEEAGEAQDEDATSAEDAIDGREEVDPYDLYGAESLDSGLSPLSAKQALTYRRIMTSAGPENQVLATHPISQEEILRTDFFRLGPGSWLSDEVRVLHASTPCATLHLMYSQGRISFAM